MQKILSVFYYDIITTMESTEDPQRGGQSIATHDACPEDREEICRTRNAKAVLAKLYVNL
jgi:hypothetical protein